MKLPNELIDLKKMKLTYIAQKIISISFGVLAFVHLVCWFFLPDSNILETLFFVGIATIVMSNASQTKNSFFLYQKLKEIQDQISNEKKV